MHSPFGPVISYLFILSLMLIISAPVARGWPTRPNHDLTPGVTRGLTVTRICNTTWGSDARSVKSKMKKDVIAAYKFKVSTCPTTILQGKRTHRVEIDHLVPRSIGGADDVRNLWPQCYEPVKKNKAQQANGAHKKDRLEKKLHKRICKVKSASLLKKNQSKKKRNWIYLYKKIYDDE